MQHIDMWGTTKAVTVWEFVALNVYMGKKKCLKLIT